jgi:tetratricopeptide (TPR) repeat protein
MVRRGQSFSGYEPHCFFLNTRGTRFADLSALSGIDFPDDGRAAALTDWDLDGDLDLWILNRNGPQLRFLRNDIPVDHGFLALVLVGTTCNRDAIGARVEVVLKSAEAHSSLIKTLRAGDGFLAQSSKSLHFGLGKRPAVERVIVHWPGGQPETFSDLTPNRRYRLVQGSGEARVWKTPRRHVQLAAAPLRPSPVPAVRRHFLPVPVPLPRIEFRTFTGETQEAAIGRGRPVLLNLWASWCMPCRAELKAWTAQEAALREVGVEILTLSVDGLALSKETEPVDAQRFLETTGFPFSAGIALADVLDKLEILQQELFDYYFPFAVPISFLIDERGMLSALYRGPVSVDTLIEDLRKLDTGYEERVALSVPFPGKWAFKTQYPPGDLADGFQERFPDEAIRYLRFAVGRHESDLTNPGLTERLREFKEEDLRGDRGRLISALARNHNLEEAEQECARAIAQDPSSTAYRRAYIEILLRQGRFDDGVGAYRELTARHPEAERRGNLGTLLDKLKLQHQAVEALEERTRVEPENPQAFLQLGFLYAQCKRTDEAIAVLERATTLDPGLAEAHVGLAHMHRQNGALEESARHLDVLIGLNIRPFPAHVQLAEIRIRQRRPDEAAAHYRDALSLNPDHPPVTHQLAWLLATHPDDAIRDGAEAVTLATNACRLTENRNHRYLFTLAAAYAEAGRFDRAENAAQEAITLARTSGDEKAAARIASAAEGFQHRRPVRELTE